MVVPVIGGKGNNQTNAPQSSGVVPVIQSTPINKGVVPVHTQASSLSVQKPQQQNFLQQSGNFLSGVWNGAVGEVGSILHPQPQAKTTTPKFQATQTPTKLPMGMKLTLSSPQANQSGQTKTNQQSLKQQGQTSKNITNAVNTVGKTFPETTKLYNELNIDPANFKANPKKIIDDYVKANKDSWNNFGQSVQNFSPSNRKNLTGSQKLGAQLDYFTKGVGALSSPITALFSAANDVPVLGSLSKLLNLGFTAVGETGANVSGFIVDKSPLPANVKKNIKPGIEEIGALAAQLATGKITEIAPKTRFQLISKYGPEDAKVIVSKAQEAAKSQTIEPGTYTPQELRDQVFQKGIENTDHGKKMLATSIYAEQQGRNITISNPHEAVDTFNKNIEDYRSFGGYTAGKSTPNAALRDIEQVADTPQIKAHTQQQVQEAIKSGELKPNSDGTITLYRGGKPSSQNGLVSASYDKSVAEGFAKGGELHGIQVKPEDIKAFIGKQEKEVLIDKSALTPVENTIPEKTLETLKPVGTGETKQSTLGQKVEAKAIENKLLKDGIDKLPEYQKANMKEQGKLASDYLASNEKEATDVALGRKSAPDGIIPEAIYTAVENKAITDKNVSLLANLAKSSRVGEATAMGQRIRTLAERNPDSPVTHITNLLNKRIKSVEDRTGKPIEKLREEEVSKIKKVQGEQKKPDKYDWNNFISSIQC